MKTLLNKNKKQVLRDAKNVLGKEMREILDSELKAIDGGHCTCHANSSCKRRT